MFISIKANFNKLDFYELPKYDKAYIVMNQVPYDVIQK